MDFQTALIVALQTNAPNLTIFMLIISILGLQEFYLMLIPLILWCYDKKLGLRIIFLLTISNAINAMLKILFHTPRPYWVSSEVKAFASSRSFGMPSGHAQTSLTFMGYIGASLKKRSLWVICIPIIILVAISRLYLGVHFLTDILAGWFFAIVILLAFLHYEKSFSEWFLQKPIGIRIIFALCTSFTFVILSQMIEIIVFNLHNWQVPAEWSTLAFTQTHDTINPTSLRDTIMDAGILFGAAVGASISAEYFPYVVDGSYSKKIVRYLTGIIILALFWVIFSAVTKTPDLTGYGMTYFRAALAGLWVTGGAPFVFCKTGIANKG